MDVPPRSTWRVSRATPHPGRPNLSGLLELGVDAIPVRIAIQQDGFVTGWDDGALGFEEDAVWFSGRATSFRVFATDVWRFGYRPDELATLSPGALLDRGIPLRHPSRDVKIGLRVLTTPGRRGWEDGVRVAFEIRRLVQIESLAGTSHYPPLSSRPGAEVVPRSDWNPMMGLMETFAEPDRLVRFFVSFKVDPRREALLQSLVGESTA